VAQLTEKQSVGDCRIETTQHGASGQKHDPLSPKETPVSTNKVNKAALRRERESLLAARAAGPEPLPDEYVTYLNTEYSPRGELANQWPTLHPFVHDVLLHSHVRGQQALRIHTSIMTHFASWLRRNDKPLELASVNRENIAEYCRVGMRHSTKKSASDQRSRLNNVADAVNPDQAPHRGVTVPREAIRPPYTPEEMVLIRDALRVQAPSMVRKLSLCVGAGAGAGLDSVDLRHLTGGAFDDRGEGGIRIDVAGPRPRQVWVLREYEHLVRAGIVGIGENQLVLGRVPGRKHIAAHVFDDAEWHGNLPKLDQARLRTTWLTTLMARPIPLAVICHAAGLRSTRTLFDLLDHVGTSVDIVGDLLRDGSAR
jgi:hypothetical protein